MRVVVLISGRGTNLQSIIEGVRAGELPIMVETVISNNPGAGGLGRAQSAGIPTVVIDHREFTDRARFDTALIREIDRHDPELVVLAGFMRILGSAFIRHYAGRLMNIHPSLLPALPGLDTHARAIRDGHRRHGATVHFVGEQVDCGPIIVQAEVPVQPDDTVESLAARVLVHEHRIYPLAIRWFAEHRLAIEGDRVTLDGRILTGAKP